MSDPYSMLQDQYDETHRRLTEYEGGDVVPRSDYDALQAKVRELEERLEIDHEYECNTATGQTERVEIPPEERARFPDGIACRDATIKLQDERIAQLKREKADLEQSRQHFHDVADMRGRAILHLTEKWAERRRYHREQFKRIMQVKANLEAKLRQAEVKCEGEPEEGPCGK